jgi:predicted MFS family arabinose efflux permease
MEPAAPTDSAKAAPKRNSMRVEIMEGLRYIGGHRLLRSIAASTSTSNLFNQIAFAIIAVYLYRELTLTPDLVGLLGGVGGAGVMAGAVLASRLGTRFGIGRTIIGSMMLTGPIGLLIPVAALAPSLAVPLLGASFFVGGFANVVYNVNQVSLRQAITPEAMLGRMNATMRFLVWGTIPVGALIGAALSEMIGVTTTIWIGAILGSFAFLPVLLSPVRRLQRIPDAEEAAAFA